jgi:hypothetical protein
MGFVTNFHLKKPGTKNTGHQEAAKFELNVIYETVIFIDRTREMETLSLGRTSIIQKCGEWLIIINTLASHIQLCHVLLIFVPPKQTMAS